ncbi:eukaryotic translation initiation factor 3 subunit M [Cryptococcus bacillisporus CA1280]|uniref:Eukaryotic translation initiation factor 3 subunit M n=2 Tax=Cryptococcus gattii TaxID=552467 RepID=A0A0D0VMC2_CRYGA|nr:eukaryotic translation initiation factor 3 subunit M [Cryptococcus bacillisporus CA1280]KIR69249.1 eukaryotic translation initiation factor 3 subunit M [Cryptococcus bacillisporus CA1873]|eukprot:KIR69249.1 eukaryotic translation initiation factor 3 subunit M [Cryptococcus gattii CA1873]
MADCITIAPELSFKDQITELAAHLSRSLPNADNQVAVKEFVQGYENQVATEEGKDDVEDAKKKQVVKSIVDKFVELKGGLEAAKESEVESSHFLLQHVLSTTFDQASEEYVQAVKDVNEAVKKGAQETTKITRAEAASRVLKNTYNFLPSNSPIRPSTLLALMSLLASTLDLSALPLPTSTLLPALSSWSIPSSEKVSFLTTASGLYQSTGNLAKALELLTLALKESVEPTVVEKAVLLALAVPNRFELDDVLAVQGVKEQLGKVQGVAELFEGDEIEAIEKGKKWAAENVSLIEGAGIPGFTSETILRKLRLIALVALCAKSETRQLEYAPIAKALAIEESEVETWVIDAVRSKLIVARISQPQSLIRIQSISSLTASSRRFGPNEWQLLEKRLEQWKKSVNEARQVVEEAELVAQQGLGQQRRGGKRREEKKEKEEKEEQE